MLQILTTFHCARISLMFQVEFRVLVAVEGVPVLLQITLTYKGTHDLLVHRPRVTHCAAIYPDQWGPCFAVPLRPIFMAGPTMMSIRPSDKIVCIVSPTEGLVCRSKAGDCDIVVVGGFAFVSPERGL